MATTESAGKVCIVCGKDVTGQPRVKDAMGRYMCAGECEKKAAAAAKAKEAARAARPPMAPPSAAAKTSTPPPLEPGGLMGQLIADSPMLKSATCESCGNPMPGGAVLCTRCGFNTSTGKALKTAVIIEKEKKEEKIKDPRRYSGEFGPSFGVLFLITAGSLGAIFALGYVNPLFLILGFLLALLVHLVGAIWGIVDAFRQGETLWGIVGVIGIFLGLPGLAFLYYMLVVNELKWSKSLYLGSIVGFVVGLAIMFGALGLDFGSLSKGGALP